MTRFVYMTMRITLTVAYLFGLVLIIGAFIILLCLPESTDLIRSLALILGSGCTGLLICANATWIDRAMESRRPKKGR